MFGISGNDAYHVNGTSNRIKIRVISGNKKDSVINESDNGLLRLAGLPAERISEIIGNNRPYPAITYSILVDTKPGRRTAGYSNQDARCGV